MTHILFAAILTMRLATIANNFDGKVGVFALDLDTRQRAVLNENMNGQRLQDADRHRLAAP